MCQALQVKHPLPTGNKSESIYGTITCFFIYVWRFRDSLHVNQNNVWQSSKANQGEPCDVFRWRSKYKIPLGRITDQSSAVSWGVSCRVRVQLLIFSSRRSSTLFRRCRASTEKTPVSRCQWATCWKNRCSLRRFWLWRLCLSLLTL